MQIKNVKKDWIFTGETYGDLSQIQETGLYTIYNKESHTWNQVAAVVDEGTGEITAMYNNMVGASAGWSESMAKDAEKMIKKRMMQVM